MQLHQNIAFGKPCWKFIGVDIWMFQVEQLLLKMLLVSLYINESPALTQAEREITWSRFKAATRTLVRQMRLTENSRSQN